MSYELNHPQHSEQELITRLEKIFMCEVSQRYAFTSKIGVEHRALKQIDLSGSPDMAVNSLLHFLNKYYLKSWIRLEDQQKFMSKLIDAILMTKLNPHIENN